MSSVILWGARKNGLAKNVDITKADLGGHVHDFFHSYLLEQRGLRLNTIKSYRDTLKLLLLYARSRRRTSGALSIRDFDVQLILAFLKNLEDAQEGRGNCARTRNQRLAAIQCFFKYLSIYHHPLERQAKRILAIPVKRCYPREKASLSRKELEVLLAQPPTTTADGIRDLTMLTFAYNTGARAQEIADTQLARIDFQNRMVEVIGKGNKPRPIPIWPATARLVELYKNKHRRTPRSTASGNLFINQRGGPFTRFGVWTIVRKYLRLAIRTCPGLAAKQISPHSLRHTMASHMLEACGDLNLVKALLGHEDLSTTSRYTHDVELTYKRRIMDQCAPPHYVVSFLESKSDGSVDTILNSLAQL
jgi:site-specific recombinase XerD